MGSAIALAVIVGTIFDTYQDGVSEMKMHPREKIVDEWDRKLQMVLLEMMESDLTPGEFLSVIGSVLGGAITQRAKYMIRYERHGDGDTPGGLE